MTVAVVSSVESRDGGPLAAESDVRGLQEMFPVFGKGMGGHVPQVRFRGDQLGIALRA